jgi:hypothetical protein
MTNPEKIPLIIADEALTTNYGEWPNTAPTHRMEDVETHESARYDWISGHGFVQRSPETGPIYTHACFADMVVSYRGIVLAVIRVRRTSAMHSAQ